MSGKVHILFLSELFYPHGGGAEFATYLYAKLLSESGYDVIVVTNRFPQEHGVSKNEGFIIYRIPLFKLGGSLKYSTLRRFDVLFSSFMKRLMRWADVVYIPRRWYSAIPLAKTYKKPVITHLHDYFPFCPLATLYNQMNETICYRMGRCSANCIYFFEAQAGKLRRTFTSTLLNATARSFLIRMLKLSDSIICVSKYQKNILANYSQSIKEKAQVIYNPIPPLSHIDLEGDDFGYFGGPNYLKGFEVLRRALTLLKNTSIRVHATNFPHLQATRLAGSLQKLGIVLYDRLERSKHPWLYRKIRAVLVPSIVAETWSYVVTEAILRGRVVVASRIGGIPEQTRGCKGVFLFEPGNFRELAEEIEYISSLPREVMSAMGAQNKEEFINNFSNQKSLEAFSELCNRLLENSK